MGTNVDERIDNPQILLHHLLQEYLVERDINLTSVNLRCLLQTFSWVTYWQGVGASCPGRFILPPPPPSRISNKMENQQFLLHHQLQKYLVERDINFISVNLRCLLQMFSWVMYCQGVGGQAVRGSLSCPPLPPPPRISKRMDNPQILLHHLLQEYLAERDTSVSLRCLHQCSVGLRIDKGWGASCPGQFILPPARISERMDNPQILLHHLLQKYLVERDINFISVNLRCLLQQFIWVTYRQGVGVKLSRAVYLAPNPEFQKEWIISKF